MDMDIDETAKDTPLLKNAAFYHSRSSSPSVIIKPVVVILVGAPRSGKSTFCEHVMRSTRPWVCVCQDTIKIGKAGTKGQCIDSAMNALKDG
ncbi:hypothetical protein ACFX1Q_010680 [Malus domestica]